MNDRFFDLIFYTGLVVVGGLAARYYFYKQAISSASGEVERAKTRLLEEHNLKVEKGYLNKENDLLTTESGQGNFGVTEEVANSLCNADPDCSFAQKILSEFIEALPLVENQYFVTLQVAALYLTINHIQPTFFPFTINSSGKKIETLGDDNPIDRDHTYSKLSEECTLLKEQVKDLEAKAELVQEKISDRYEDLTSALRSVIQDANISTLQSAYGDQPLTTLAKEIPKTSGESTEKTKNEFLGFDYIINRADSVFKHYEQVFGKEGNLEISPGETPLISEESNTETEVNNNPENIDPDDLR